MMPKISLIVPFYHVEQWIEECLNSLVHQTMTDIEIVCIDDCSPDGSRAIVEKYMANDSRIKLITHTENKRQGGGRNSGVQHASGEYLWFIDSDDLIPLDACEVLYRQAKQHQASALIFALAQFQDGSVVLEVQPTPMNKICLQSEKLFTAQNMANENLFWTSVWHTLWHRETYNQSGFSFCEKTLFEDNFIALLLLKQKRIFFSSYVGYYYRQRQNSTTSSSQNLTQNFYPALVQQINHSLIPILEKMSLTQKNENWLHVKNFFSYLLARPFWVYHCFVLNAKQGLTHNLIALKSLSDLCSDQELWFSFLEGKAFYYCFILPIKQNKSPKIMLYRLLYLYHWHGYMKSKVCKILFKPFIKFLPQKIKTLFTSF